MAATLAENDKIELPIRRKLPGFELPWKKITADFDWKCPVCSKFTDADGVCGCGVINEGLVRKVQSRNAGVVCSQGDITTFVSVRIPMGGRCVMFCQYCGELMILEPA